MGLFFCTPRQYNFGILWLSCQPFVYYFCFIRCWFCNYGVLEGVENMIILPCLEVFFTGASYLFHVFWLMFVFFLIFKIGGLFK